MLRWYTGGFRACDVSLFKVRNGKEESEPKAVKQREPGEYNCRNVEYIIVEGQLA